MSTERFEIPVDGATVFGAIHRPAGTVKKSGWPALLVCGGFPIDRDDQIDIADQITVVMSEAGMTVATFQPRFSRLSESSLSSHRAIDVVDDASAVFRWLTQQTDVDMTRIGVVGYSSAAIVSACLCGRSDRIAALCLLNPISPSTTCSRIATAVKEEGESSKASIDATAFIESFQDLHPIDDAAAHDRPTLVLHGAADRTAGPGHAQAYRDRLVNAGHQVTQILVARGDHGFTTVEARVACMEVLRGFFMEMPALEPTPVA